MKRLISIAKISFLIVFMNTGFNAYAQKTSEPDLKKLFESGKIKAFNRVVTIISSEKNKSIIHLDDKPDAGVAWISDLQFSEGTIEFDTKGKNVLQRSFVGVAFHALNDSTYDAVYFRPFNFRSPEEERRNHSVQYISLPGYDWPKLRKEKPNQYEKPINPAPEPEEWIHVRLTVQNQEVKVFVNKDQQPSLVIKQLSDRKNGKIGFWAGSGSDGDFANLKIQVK